eukprot:SM000169S02737  [mRNA]  locus=s169:214285:214662:- [translate_table: standard]
MASCALPSSTIVMARGQLGAVRRMGCSFPSQCRLTFQPSLLSHLSALGSQLGESEKIGRPEREKLFPGGRWLC